VRDAAELKPLTPLAWTRAAFAAVLLIRTTPLMFLIDSHIGADAVPMMGWPTSPSFHAAVFGLALPPIFIQILCVSRTCAALLLLVGYRPLLTGPMSGISGYLVVLQDVFSFTFTQHLLYTGAILIGLTDCATTLAVRPEEARAPRTSYFLLWTLVTSIYFWAALGKLRRDWFDGRTLALFFEEGKFREPLAQVLLGTASGRAAAGTTVVVTELALIPLLWWPRTRLAGLFVAFGLHVTIEAIARPDVFGWAMIALLLSFVPTVCDQHHREVQAALSNGQTKSP
jgi:hypothetical protein